MLSRKQMLFEQMRDISMRNKHRNKLQLAEEKKMPEGYQPYFWYEPIAIHLKILAPR